MIRIKILSENLKTRPGLLARSNLKTGIGSLCSPTAGLNFSFWMKPRRLLPGIGHVANAGESTSTNSNYAGSREILAMDLGPKYQLRRSTKLYTKRESIKIIGKLLMKKA